MSSSLDNLQGHTICKVIEVDGELMYERDMTYEAYVEELAETLYDNEACHGKTRIRWNECNKHNVKMPTMYPARGVVWRYKVID